MGIGSLGVTEMAVIFVIALLVFGPKRLPELGRSLGSAMREFRRSVNEIQRELEQADPVRPLKEEANSILRPPPPAPPSPPDTEASSSTEGDPSAPR